jgi:predicted Zn-dependent peptidase
MKAGIFMALESTQSRAGHMLSDFFTFGRVRSTREMAESLDRVTLDDVNRFLATHPPEPLTLVTLGPKSLSMPA